MDNKMNKNRYIVIGGIVALVLIIILSIVLVNNYNEKKQRIGNEEIREIINNKGSLVIYMYNYKSSNDIGPKILKHLKDKKVDFRVYDVSKIEGSEYVGLLDMFNIDRELFGYPAIIYIKNGVMFANIININDLDVVDTFVKDYNL